MAGEDKYECPQSTTGTVKHGDLHRNRCGIKKKSGRARERLPRIHGWTSRRVQSTFRFFLFVFFDICLSLGRAAVLQGVMSLLGGMEQLVVKDGAVLVGQAEGAGASPIPSSVGSAGRPNGMRVSQSSRAPRAPPGQGSGPRVRASECLCVCVSACSGEILLARPPASCQKPSVDPRRRALLR